MIFGQNWAKYQGYSLTFWRKLAHSSHFSLYNPNQEKWFLVKIGQNTKAIALLFGQNWPILATFHSTIQIRKNDFGQNWAKYQGYSLTLWAKLAHFSHFSLYNPNQEKWFLVKIGQNTKAIALLFGQNWPILATFHSTIQIKKMIFGQNWAKYQGYSLSFWAKLAHFSHFSLYNPKQEKWFFVKIGQNTKAIVFLFGQNWPILATFHFTIQSRKNDFLSKLGKIPRL